MTFSFPSPSLNINIKNVLNLQVRPEEVLEKALLMVQNSQKNYLYKCDQLKSIRQDLTVQRIRNQLTVKVLRVLIILRDNILSVIY